jgi:hypothetical protein
LIDAPSESDISLTSGCQPTTTGTVNRQPVIVTVEATLYAASCCSTASLLASLAAHLRGGQCGGGSCEGTTLAWPRCAPSTAAPSCATISVPSETAVVPFPVTPWRQLKGVRYLGDLEVVERGGLNCGGCGCGPATKVRWSWAAAPGWWTGSAVLFDQPLTTGTASGACVIDFGTCSSACPDTSIVDPDCTPFALPPRPSGVARRCGCVPLERNRTCFTVDLTGLPTEYPTYGTFQITSPNGPVRNATVRWWPEQPGLPFDAYADCSTCGGFRVDYTAGGADVLSVGPDGATVTAAGRASRSAAGVVSGLNGLPFTGCTPLPCRRLVICVDVDPANTPAGARLKLSVAQVEPTVSA